MSASHRFQSKFLPNSLSPSVLSTARVLHPNGIPPKERPPSDSFPARKETTSASFLAPPFCRNSSKKSLPVNPTADKWSVIEIDSEEKLIAASSPFAPKSCSCDMLFPVLCVLSAGLLISCLLHPDIAKTKDSSTAIAPLSAAIAR